MNALSITWKLRTEMLAILSACGPEPETRDSERRLVQSPVLCQKSDIRGLLTPSSQGESEVDGNVRQPAGVEQSSPGV
jgi:hypothetical protein